MVSSVRILMLSQSGDGLGLAHRLVSEGHKVDVFIRESQYKMAGVGIVDRVPSWRPHLAKADLVVADMVGFGNYEATIKEAKKPLIGCSPLMDVAELDRQRGINLLVRAGIDIPETFSFKGPKQARDILKVWKDPGYVIKPSGNISTAKTSVARFPELYEHALGLLEEAQPLIVQRIVEGVEVSTEGWWNGRNWVFPFNHTFEEKRFMNEGLGPNTGCMGNIVVAARKVNKLVGATVLRLEGFLKQTNYRGPIDVNSIVTADKAYALEITARFGYDALEAVMEGLQEPVTDLIFETAVGIKKEMRITNGYMIAVRLSVPPWPHDEPAKEEAGQPILGLNEHNLKHVYLTDVYKKNNKYFYAAGDGTVLKATADGASVREARRRVYRTLGGIQIGGKQYRTDIGERVEGDMAKLKEWGWL